MLQNPNLPEKLRSAQRLAGGDARRMGQRRRHQRRARRIASVAASLRKTRAQIDAFRPDFIVMWGDDQYENFNEDVVPPYCV